MLIKYLKERLKMLLQVKSFSPVRNNKNLFKPLDITLKPGKIICILGASGKGKTSIFESIRNKCQFNGHIDLRSSVFSVWQKTEQFFPWFTIRKNILFANKNDKKYIDISKKWKINHLLDRYPSEVSGGQLQRFVLIRAIISGHKILLCDESLNSLDNFTGNAIAHDFKKIIKKEKIGCLWITHNILESNILADKTVKI